MVRQDKIAHLITGFRTTLLKPIYPNESLMDLFIRTILSQGTKDELRDRAFENLKSQFSNWRSILDAQISEIQIEIEVCGLSEKKANTIFEFIKWVKLNFPDFNIEEIRNWNTNKVFAELTSIKGIGNKTVSIFICFGLKGRSFPVDVHVHRILTRMGISSNVKNPDTVFKEVSPFIPVGKEFFLHVHLVEHGKKICKSSNPNCTDCMFNQHCDFLLKKNGWAES